MKKLLILTDHKSHLESDSIFEISKYLNAKFDIWICSRGDSRNNNFFDGSDLHTCYAKNYDSNFLYENTNKWFGDQSLIFLHEFSSVFLRIDFPVNNAFLKALPISFSGLIVNDPTGIEKTINREFLLQFPSNIPESGFANTINQLLEITKNRDCVIKLENSYGGTGVFRSIGTKRWKSVSDIPGYILKRIESNINLYAGVFVQQYLPNVSAGDKRIIVAFGTPIGSVLRIPKKGEWRCNVAQGGLIEKSTISNHELNMVQDIDTILKKQGVYVYGIDTLLSPSGVRLISELNVLNVGGFTQITEYGGINACQMLAELYQEHLKNYFLINTEKKGTSLNQTETREVGLMPFLNFHD